MVIQVGEGHDLSPSHSQCKKGVLIVSLTGKTKNQWGEALSGAGKCDWMFSHANRVVKSINELGNWSTLSRTMSATSQAQAGVIIPVVV